MTRKNRIKLSDYIIDFLEKRKTKYIFGYIGGAITHLVDSAHKNKNIKFIQVYHEQTAAIAAEGYSMNSEGVGVAMATSGPGATNLITGIADAYLDSIPCIFITGQVNTHEYKYNKPIRQQGFQETDIINIVKPITKYAVLIDDPNKIKYYLEKAFFIVRDGRPGPVLLDIPLDIQRKEINLNELQGYTAPKIRSKKLDIEQIKRIIGKSKRPMLLAGGGLINSKAQKQLFIFAKKNKIPVVTSLMGKGSFPEDSPLYVGMIGSYGNRCANICIANSDLLISIGSRLDTRQTGTALNSFLRKGKIIQVDIDENELKYHRLKRRYCIKSDAKLFLNNLISKTQIKPREEWLEYISKIKEEFNQQKEINNTNINKFPYIIIKRLNEFSKKNNLFFADVGQNQMFAAQMLKITKNQRFFTSGGLAPMGYALPAAIGASFAYNHKRKIFVITGDGGFHISLQSLMLISQYKIPINIIVLNNQSLGMIRQFQELYFNKKEVATTKKSGYLVPDIKKIAEAYNLKYYSIKKEDLNHEQYLKKILKNSTSSIIECFTGTNTTVVPKLEVNKPIEELSPKVELKNFMLIPRFERKNFKNENWKK